MRPLATLRAFPLLLTGLLCAAAPAGATVPDPPQYMLKWGSQGSAAGQFSSPNALATDELGNVYVLDSSNYRVQKFDRLGAFITQWGSYGSANGQLYNPSGIAVDLAGNVFVADGGNGRIQKFTSMGTYVDQWGTFGTGVGQFTGMGRLAVDAAGNVYVPDMHRVQKFSNIGLFMTQWGSLGSGNGQFNGPCAVAAGPGGNVYVVDRLNSRVQKFTSSGAYVAQWSQAANMSDIAVDALGDVYIIDDNNFVMRYNSGGTFEIGWGGTGAGDGQFNAPKSLDVDAEGNVYVCDTGNHRVQKYSGCSATVSASAPGYFMQWGSAGAGAGQLSNPTGVVTDPAGNAYVVDSGNNRVQKFGPGGNFITQWGSFGTGAGQFLFPVAIARDAVGNIYVTDDGNRRVQKFTSSGAWITMWGSNGSGNGQFISPRGIAIDPAGDVYVSDAQNNRIQKFTSNGGYLLQWGTPTGSGPGQLSLPVGVATDALGNVYVVDYGNYRIQKFTSSGTYITSWGGTRGFGEGEFELPWHIAVDAGGDVYVADMNTHYIQRFAPNGAFLARWTGPSPGEGLTTSPVGIAIDPTGTLVVTDYAHARVMKFTTSPTVAFVSDVRNDQGRFARLRILRASADSPLSGATITGYAVYRRQDPPAVSLAGAASAGLPSAIASPRAAQLAGWDYVTTIPARGDAEYGVVVPTLADANATSRAYSAFFVSALTSNPYQYFDSLVESGYSIDNLSPGSPAPFLAVYVSGGTHLHWGASTATDFATFRLYRGPSADFTPAPANLVAATPDTGYVDVGTAGRYYKVAAVDFSGNESPYALVGPSQTVEAGHASGPLAFAVEKVRPNPARGSLLEVRITLPDETAARVELIDVAGRKVVEREVSGAGDHVVALGRAHALTSGAYLVRVTRGSDVRVRRAVVVD